MFEALLEGGSIERVLDENVVLSELRDSERRALEPARVLRLPQGRERPRSTPGSGPLYRLSIPNREVREVYTTTFRALDGRLSQGPGRGYLKLLDNMDAFCEKESEHFIVMYDAKLDPVIPSISAITWKASIRRFAILSTTAARPTLRSFRRTTFSVRTTGSPWIGTVGASTGAMIALVAPLGRGVRWEHSTGRRCCGMNSRTP